MAKKGWSVNFIRSALLATAMLVGACSVIPRVTIHNLTGAPITLRLEADYYDRQQAVDELITIDPGHDRTFKAGRVRGNRLPVKVGRCTYAYWLGDISNEMYDHFGDTLVFDLRPDLALHVPSNKGTGHDLAPSGQVGFPRRAISRTCG